MAGEGLARDTCGEGFAWSWDWYVVFFCACPLAGLVYEKAWDTTMIRLRGPTKSPEYRKQLRPRFCAGEQTDFPLYSFEISSVSKTSSNS